MTKYCIAQTTTSRGIPNIKFGEETLHQYLNLKISQLIKQLRQVKKLTNIFQGESYK